MWKGYLVYYYIKLIKLVIIVIKNSNNLFQKKKSSNLTLMCYQAFTILSAQDIFFF